MEGLEPGSRDRISNDKYEVVRKYWGGNKVDV